MEESGKRNPACGVEAVGLDRVKRVFWNLPQAELAEHAIRRGEARFSSDGAVVATTGKHTGRSPKDKFIVRDEKTENTIWWGGNGAMEPEAFERLREDFLAHADGMTLYAQDMCGGADPVHRLNVRVYTELAWHSLFIHNLLRVPDAEARASFLPEFTVIDLPSFKADPERHGCRTETVIAVNFSKKLILIGGSAYAGEIKKSVFTLLNYLLPEKGVMPMHCSANEAENGDVAIFFGLSGTGKTTLSADPERTLIGDDEHGWSENGVFNFEGGCYAKTIRLSADQEPEIYAASTRFGTVLENVVLDEDTRKPDFDDGSLTENTRSAYPLDYIANASDTGMGGQPNHIVMLTCDAFGVLPPISKLSAEQAMVHFLSGYTAKVAGTERGVTEPEATFSTCFGAPFMPRLPAVYGDLLREHINKHAVTCWLVNTGWSGGPYGVGKRMPLKLTRRLLEAALEGTLEKAPMEKEPVFGLEIPTELEGVDSKVLHPRETWSDKAAYDRQAEKLLEMFSENFKQFAGDVDAEVLAAAPRLKDAAE
ncbi:phosphoenolpyruvate carboxykinase [Afifella marina]|uniref:Phosphoenolpyruvate carboxykinase (ATP) n=1 Tax=Afifella marina DSM 2698 TaxID=1120955 RepID=A0A1G5NCI4_AFIMA|nr:phosphoenolpyruvate carboxykinase [Afifella marina]MBK1623300.1 phosphoenolpyruvate carboxykinase [Afifella marina DSM 2698]MBK1626294.1 phosphoenolpyruvate carboxykinase [Afifella marina]MBK5917172.1 phosphoenolpyruvate carboxykinase (ATP) [Afifella marina]RAI22147.1 phosphoenolpyruvate carboxykinase (ATP) [Afifella marina DSM 2698]SCZ35135.1 phosphoenolpyruvate carboxykinase (ATP) [Afifella marina DSM 2698]